MYFSRTLEIKYITLIAEQKKLNICEFFSSGSSCELRYYIVVEENLRVRSAMCYLSLFAYKYHISSAMELTVPVACSCSWAVHPIYEIILLSNLQYSIL
jgi:hypothetical protein